MLKVLHMLRCKWTCGVILHYAAMSNIETICKDDASWTMSHGCIQLAFFTTVLDHERLRDHIHQITFQMTGLDLSIQNIQRGISCNTCRLVETHPQRSVNTSHQRINQVIVGKCVFFHIRTVQVLGSVAFERPWVELGLLACRMFGGSSLFSCLRNTDKTNGKVRLYLFSF